MHFRLTILYLCFSVAYSHSSSSSSTAITHTGKVTTSLERAPEQELIEAVANGNIDTTTVLLQGCSNIDGLTKEGLTLFHVAALNGQDETLELLLEYGANPGAVSTTGDDALHCALQKHHVRSVRLLLKRDLVSRYGLQWGNLDEKTPYQLARQKLEELRELKAETSPNKEQKENYLTMILKVVKVFKKFKVICEVMNEWVKILRESGDPADNYRIQDQLLDECYEESSLSNNCTIVPLDFCANILFIKRNSGSGKELLRILANEKSYILAVEMCMWVMSRKEGFESTKQILDFLALDACVRLLRKKGGMVYRRNEPITPLERALVFDHSEGVTALLEMVDVKITQGPPARTNPDNRKESTPWIFLAVSGCSYQSVLLLVSKEADLHALSNNQTALHAAVSKSADVWQRINEGTNLTTKEREKLDAKRGELLKIITLLHQKKVPMMPSDSERSSTPLHAASFSGDAEVVSLLLDFGADPNAINQEKKTSLHVAAERGQTDCLRKLLNQKGGALINKKTGYKRTPLHFASMNGHEECVRLLLTNGADPFEKDSYKKTALDLALKGREENKWGETGLHFLGCATILREEMARLEKGV